jgi:hypothetical protein
MVNAIFSYCNDYYDQIPPDTLPKVVRSAAYTFTFTCIQSGLSNSSFNLARPLFAAGAASLASLIYALTVPLFNMAYRDNRVLFQREFVKQYVNMALTSLALEYITTGKVNLVAINLLGSFSCNLMLGIFEMVPTFADWIGDPNAANEIRQGLKYMGLDAVPGSSSVFINFGHWGT